MHVDAVVDAAAGLDPAVPADDGWWVEFYEAFIRCYDRQLQKNRGVYYTPPQIVDFQVRACDWVLRNVIGVSHGFAAREVNTLDPACGTGTYLSRLITHVAARTEAEHGAGAVREAVEGTVVGLFGFELMIAPYTVARMRVAAKAGSYGASATEPGVLLTDTLAATGLGETPSLWEREIADQQQRANDVKDPRTRVTVVLGNPPYDRDQSRADTRGGRRLGGMIRHGDRGGYGLLKDVLDRTPPAMRRQSQAVHEMSTYFWRWAVWKVCEQQHPGRPGVVGGPGVVSFISPSAFLRSDPWAGMRALLRSRFDQIWVVDLGGDQRGTRDDGGNVFPIQTPVCVTVAVRSGPEETPTPAQVRYHRLNGTRAEKLVGLGAVELDNADWSTALSGDVDQFVPVGGDGWYATHPRVDAVLPWRSPGVKYNRRWPVGLTEDVLRERWQRLVAADQAEKRRLFKETGDRTLTSLPKRLRHPDDDAAAGRVPVGAVGSDGPCPPAVRYGWRPFDTRWALPDSRLGDRLRPLLRAAHSPKQAYLVTPKPTEAAGAGPAAVVYTHIPDNDSHHGRGGGGGGVPSLERPRSPRQQHRPRHSGPAHSQIRAASHQRRSVVLRRWAARNSRVHRHMVRTDGSNTPTVCAVPANR